MRTGKDTLKILKKITSILLKNVSSFLFFPIGKGPFPGIVDMYTFGGGVTEPRASLLANKGFVVLALAYIGYQDLLKKPEKLDLEYFEEAVAYLRGLPEVSSKE